MPASPRPGRRMNCVLMRFRPSPPPCTAPTLARKTIYGEDAIYKLSATASTKHGPPLTMVIAGEGLMSARLIDSFPPTTMFFGVTESTPRRPRLRKRKASRPFPASRQSNSPQMNPRRSSIQRHPSVRGPGRGTRTAAHNEALVIIVSDAGRDDFALPTHFQALTATGSTICILPKNDHKLAPWPAFDCPRSERLGQDTRSGRDKTQIVPST
jgi:hypothetical protein